MRPPYEEFPHVHVHTMIVGIYDLAVLLKNVWEAGRDPLVGHADCRLTLQEFLHRMQRKVVVNKDDFDNMVWASQMLAERGKFWHPKDETMEQFMARAFPRYTYDKDFCLTTKKEKTDAKSNAVAPNARVAKVPGPDGSPSDRDGD